MTLEVSISDMPFDLNSFCSFLDDLASDMPVTFMFLGISSDMPDIYFGGLVQT
jgi:hypothetical protein